MESEKERVGVKKEGEKKRDSLVRFLFLFFFFLLILNARVKERQRERPVGPTHTLQTAAVSQPG